jgi:Mn-dependent DtxR family transcriptional regulator
LEPYEEEVILRMYDKGYYRMEYSSVQRIASSIKWAEIAKAFAVKKKFARVLKHLSSKGYIDFHGKSGDVASLSRLGVEYAFQKKNPPDSIRS